MILQGVTMEYFQSTEDSLEPNNITQFNEYIGTRNDFWKEDFVKVTLKVSMLRNTVLYKYFTTYLLAGCPKARFDDERGRRTFGHLI